MGDQDLVAGLDGRCNALSISVKSAGSNSQHLGLVQLLDGGFGEEDTAGGLGLGLDALDQDAVEKGGERLDGLGGDGRLLFLCQPMNVSRARRYVGAEEARRRTILTVDRD